MKRLLPIVLVSLVSFPPAFGKANKCTTVLKKPIPQETLDYAKLINANESDIACLSCHFAGNVINGKEVRDIGILTHPTGNKLKCITCHDVNSNNKHFLRKEDPELCLDCHKEKVVVFKGPHGKLGRKCSKCHSVHNAQGGYLSRVVYGEISPMEPPVDGFCLACHDPEGMAEHKVLQSIYNEHPLGVKNPTTKLPGKRISCITCHDSHTYKEKLLRIPVKGNSELCLVCHSDKNLKGSHHNLSTDKGACLACHTPHNPEYKVLWSKKPAKGRTINERMCGSCHNTTNCAEKLHTPVKAGLPLINQMTGHPVKSGETGIVDCVTCHNPHNIK